MQHDNKKIKNTAAGIFIMWLIEIVLSVPGGDFSPDHTS